MIEFWLCAALLCLIALSILLLPVWRQRRLARATPVDRTAANVALYRERVAELDAQREAGALSAAQYDAASDEAGRTLLADTEGTKPGAQQPSGRAVPFLVAVLVPVLALALYLNVGSADKVALTEAFAAVPTSAAELTTRLEQAVKVQPESAEGWYFLGRAYMAEQRASDASKAFERAVALSGRAPSVLGQWAQALYFAGGKQWTAQLQGLTDEALQGDPNEETTLGLRGIAAFEGQRYAEAITYWQRLVNGLPEGDASRKALEGGIAKAQARLASEGSRVPAQQAANGAASVAPASRPSGQGNGSSASASSATGITGVSGIAESAQVTLAVDLTPALEAQVRPDDSVFIFVRAPDGPPMPLAAKRVRVVDLPIEVTLTDADAMLAGMKLSAFATVQPVARVSRAGTPTHGEWIGLGTPMATQGQGVQTLHIDRPDR